MIKIYHNPRCRKSREGFQILQESGKDFEIIEYLKESLSFDEVNTIVNLLNIPPTTLLRKNEAVWKEHFKGKTMSDLTKEQQKELKKIALEIEADAIQMRLDYEVSGSDNEGEVIFVNEESSLLKNEDEKLGTTMFVSSSQRLKRKLEEDNGEEKDD
mgnify:CR=1 FL=1